MSHLDEGTLHAMLDGELEPKEVAAIQAHVASCASCALRLREVTEFVAEADRLIASVELNATAAAGPRREALLAAPVLAPSEPVRSEPVRPEPVRSEPVRPEPVRAEPVRPEPAAADPETLRPKPPLSAEPVARTEPARPPEPVPAAASRTPPRRAGERPSRPEPWNEPPPPLFIPDNESAAERRMRRMRAFSWAAMLALLVGAGFVGVSLRPRPGPATVGVPLARPEPGAVVSPAESGEPAGGTADGTPGAGASRPAGAPPFRSAGAKPPARREAAKDDGEAERAAQRLAAKAVAPGAAVSPAPAPADASSPLDESVNDPAASADDEQADTAATEDLADVRARASEALADLDRERRRDQAAAATTALDAERRRRAAAQPPAATRQAAVAPTPPAPPTPEQRAQTYLRIGLDEASRQLGGPAHVIEGMSPLFMGLAQGVVVAGADATRPVVRVVYQDAQGRLIMLDQQRLRPGQPAPQGSPLGWTLGEMAIWLHGEAGPEILRAYRPRVR